MKSLFKYTRVVMQKPSVVLRGLKALVLINAFGKYVIRGVELAVTYQCQGKCKKCSCRSLIDNERREMSKGEVLNISKQIINAGAILINLTGGEPLLRKDIVSIVGWLSKGPIVVSLSTNGLLLTEALLKNLKRAGLNVVQISLNSPIEEEHDEEIGIRGSYRKALEGIKKARQLNIEVLINTVVTKKILYSDRMERLVNIAKEYNSFLSLILPAKVGGWEDKEVNLNQEDYKLIKRWLRLSFITADIESCYQRGVCPAGTEKVYISPYGDIYPCPFIHKNYGNVLENGFPSLWEKMRKNECKACYNIID